MTRFYKSRLFVLMLLVLGGSVLEAHAQKTPAAVQTFFEERDQAIKDVLGDADSFTEAQREELKTLINQDMDFQSWGREALGRYWKRLDEEQQSAFVQVFGDIVQSHSLADLDIYRADVVYEDISVNGDSARVLTTTTYKDVSTEIAYILAYKDDTWKVQDLVLDDVSTVEGYKRPFQSTMRKRGYDGLMTSLEKRLAKEREKVENPDTTGS